MVKHWKDQKHWCNTYNRYDIDKDSLDFANSLEEITCKFCLKRLEVYNRRYNRATKEKLAVELVINDENVKVYEKVRALLRISGINKTYEYKTTNKLFTTDSMVVSLEATEIANILHLLRNKKMTLKMIYTPKTDIGEKIKEKFKDN